MAKQQASFKTAKAKAWVTGNKEFTSKAAAYRHCRTLNGTKAGGKKPYKVERKNA
jgi:hypothetical protein